MVEPKVLCLVPQLPPAIDGVGDYALVLAQQLKQNFNLETHFIVCNPMWKGEDEVEGFSVSQVEERTPDALLNELYNFPDALAVCVNYVLHAYAARGCPFWLVEALTIWKDKDPHFNLVTMFHEAYPDLRGPWSSDFWLQPLQRNLSNKLAQISNHILVTCSIYLNAVKKSQKLKTPDVEVLPVLSTVGEIPKPLSLLEREPSLIIFGKPGNKINAYRVLENSLQLLSAMGVAEIYDIGPSCQGIRTIGGIPIVNMGQQDREVVSEILAKSRFGFVSYKRDKLTKSSIFAAYSSHGLATLNYWKGKAQKKELLPEIHYLTGASQNVTLHSCQTIANNANNWYRDHDRARHAVIWESKIRNRSVSARKICA